MKKYHWFFAAVSFVGLAAIFHFGLSRIADLDSFYYIRQSWLLRTGGLFNVDFPWMQLSIIKNLSISLWYGFALILVPFTFFTDLTFGIKLAGIIFTAAVLFCYYWVVKRHRFQWPMIWPLALFFSAPNILTQLLMVRPQIISLSLAPVLHYLLINGNWLSVGFASLAISWAHLNFAWVPVLIFGLVTIFQLIFSGKVIRKTVITNGGSVLGGVLLGWLLRPNPIGAIKLFYVQVIQQVFQKQGGLPLLFGKENLPLDFAVLIRNFSLFLVLIAIAIIVIWLNRRQYKLFSVDKKIILWTSASISTTFFLLTMIVARRTYNLWAEFGIIFIAAVFSYFVSGKSFRRFVIIAVFFMFIYSGPKGWVAISKNGYEAGELQEAALWLKDHSDTGDIVFNLHWSDFSPLFFWNQKNYYIGGLDPIFQYTYSPSLYWKFHYLSLDMVTKKTCAAIACTLEMLEDTHMALKNEFKAKYFILTKKENPAVSQWLNGDSRFEKKLDNGFQEVYLIK